jgi:dolichol-phosphate mannosyltransferase
MDISIVIPLRNEEENIGPLIGEIASVMVHVKKKYEIVLVNDHSTDETAGVMEKMKRQYPEIITIHMQTVSGKDAALVAGLNIARGNVIITMDGDGQNAPSDIPAMLEQLKSCDFVAGIRKNRKDTFSTIICSKIANAFRNWITKEALIDAGCAMRAFKKECIDCFLPYTYLLFNNAHYFFPTIVRRNGFHVRQLVVSHRKRTKGASKFPLLRGRCISGIRACLLIRLSVSRF